MNFILAVIISFSIFIAGVVAIVRYKQIHKSYYPFIYFIWIGCFNEMVSFYLATNGYYTYINSNIYVLAESILIIYYFRGSNVFKKKSAFFLLIISVLVTMWIYENLIGLNITTLRGYFRISYSAIIVLLSITHINSIIASIRQNIFKNADFLICASFIIYFTYKILVEAFWLYGLNSSKTFQLGIYDIMAYINLFINLTYALAILWMPRKQLFTMPS